MGVKVLFASLQWWVGHPPRDWDLGWKTDGGGILKGRARQAALTARAKVLRWESAGAEEGRKASMAGAGPKRSETQAKGKGEGKVQKVSDS